jgi:hypothetical protein
MARDARFREQRISARWRSIFDMHVALAHVVAGNDAVLEKRARDVGGLARKGRYPSVPFVPALSRGSSAFEQRDFAPAIDALQPITSELEGGCPVPSPVDLEERV